MTTQGEELTPAGGWLGPDSSRIPVPPKKARGVVFRMVGVLARAFRRPEVPHVFAVMNLNRRLFWGWLLFAAQMMPFGRLDARLRELVILRVGWRTRCRYEWGQHVELALNAGVADSEIVALTQDAPLFSAEKATVVIRACDELLDRALLTDATWTRLAEMFPSATVLELMTLVGHYRMLAGVLINAGTPLDEDMEHALEQFHARVHEARNEGEAAAGVSG